MMSNMTKHDVTDFLPYLIQTFSLVMHRTLCSILSWALSHWSLAWPQFHSVEWKWSSGYSLSQVVPGNRDESEWLFTHWEVYYTTKVHHDVKLELTYRTFVGLATIIACGHVSHMGYAVASAWLRVRARPFEVADTSEYSAHQWGVIADHVGRFGYVITVSGG